MFTTVCARMPCIVMTGVFLGFVNIPYYVLKLHYTYIINFICIARRS